jgi:hypothetical protein
MVAWSARTSSNDTSAVGSGWFGWFVGVSLRDRQFLEQLA